MNHYGKEISVSLRKIFNDIDFMRSEAGFKALIISIKDARKVYYRYEDLNFSILNKPLTDNELQAIDNTLEIIYRIKGIPGFTDLESTQAKLLGTKYSDNMHHKMFMSHLYLV